FFAQNRATAPVFRAFRSHNDVKRATVVRFLLLSPYRKRCSHPLISHPAPRVPADRPSDAQLQHRNPPAGSLQAEPLTALPVIAGNGCSQEQPYPVVPASAAMDAEYDAALQAIPSRRAVSLPPFPPAPRSRAWRSGIHWQSAL